MIAAVAAPLGHKEVERRRPWKHLSQTRSPPIPNLCGHDQMMPERHLQYGGPAAGAYGLKRLALRIWSAVCLVKRDHGVGRWFWADATSAAPKVYPVQCGKRPPPNIHWT